MNTSVKEILGRLVAFWMVILPAFLVHAGLPYANDIYSYYPLDEGSGIQAADKVSGNTLTNWYRGSTGYNWVTGKFGGCLNFQNNYKQAFCTATNAPIPNPPQFFPRSVTAWVNVTNIASGTPLQMAVMRLGDVSNNVVMFDMGVQTNSGTSFQPWMYNRVANANYTVAVNYLTNQWHHLADVWSSAANEVFYVDGIAVFTNAVSAATTETMNFFSLGEAVRTITFANGNNFSGYIDDVGVWTNSLTPQKVALINAMGAFESATLTNAAIDQLFAVFTNHAGSTTINSHAWAYVTGLASGVPIGTMGGTVAAKTAYVVLDGSGNGLQMQQVPGIASFTTVPSSVYLYVNNTSTLSWSVTNATVVSIDHGIGTVASSGALAVAPTITTTYTLTASNAVGQVTANVTVNVNTNPAVTSFAANPAQVYLSLNNTSTLSWSVTNATGVSIDNGIGTVPAFGSIAVAPTTTTTYTLTATNPSGVSSSAATVIVITNPVVVSFTNNIPACYSGDPVKLSWAAYNGDVSIDQGVGAVASPSGTIVVHPATTTTYTLVATNTSNQQFATATVTITVLPAAPVPQLLVDWNCNEGSGFQLNNAVSTNFTGYFQNTAAPGGGGYPSFFFTSAFQYSSLYFYYPQAGTNNAVRATGTLVTNYPYSMMVWCKLASGSAGGTIMSLTAPTNGLSPGSDYTYFSIGSSNVTVAQRYSSPADYQIFTTATNNLNDGGWHQLAAVFRSGYDFQLYVDGALSVESLTNALMNMEPFGKFSIGNLDRPGDTSHNCGYVNLDEPALYSGLLNAGDMAALYGAMKGFNFTTVQAEALRAGFQPGASGFVTVAGALWQRTTNAAWAGVTVGTTGGSVSNKTAYIIMDASGVGMQQSTPPVITAVSATPSSGARGQTTLISATVAAGSNPVNGVSVNALALGGASALALMADGAGNYTNAITVGSSVALGGRTLTVTATDTAPLTATSNLLFTVVVGTPAIVSVPTASAISYGQSLASSSLSGGVASTSGTFAFTTPATIPNAGTALQSVTFTPADTTNYATVVTNISVTVDPAALSITANNANKVYDGAAYSGGNGASYSGFVNGENSSVLGGTLNYAGDSQGALAVGSYAITPSGYTSGNYAITYHDGTLTISSGNSTISYSGASFTYNGAAQSPTINFTGSGGARSTAYAGTSYLGDAYAGTSAPTNAGSYTVSNSVAADADYAGTNASYSFAILQATNALSLTLSSAASTYGQDVSFTAAVQTNGATAADATSNVVFSVDSLPVATNALVNGSVSYTNNSLLAGMHSITAAYLGDNNYTNGVSDTNTLTVDKATPVAELAVNNSPVTYDGNGHAATVGITSSSVPGAVQNIMTGGADTQTNAGTYAVMADFVPADTVNYNTLTGVSAGNLEINKAGTSITLNSGTTFTYNGACQTPAFTIAGSTGAPSYSYSGGSYGPGANAPTNAGSYSVEIMLAADVNYVGATNTQAFSIVPASAMVSLGNLTPTYDGTAKSVSVTTAPGSLTVNVTYAGSAVAPINAGSYQVIGTVADSNYTGSATNTLTINPAALFVTANNTNKIYGQTITFAGSEFTAAGLVSGDVVASVTLSSDGTTASAAAGDHAIVPSAAVGSGLGNYTIAYANGILTVNTASSPIAQSIVADNGAAVITFSGIANVTYVTQMTTNLTGAWTAISTNTPSNGAWSVTNSVSGMNQRFYRALIP